MAFSFKHAVNAAFLGLLFAASPGFAGDTPSNEVEVGADQIQQYLVSAFPREYKALGGLFTLTARNPELSIPREGNRLLMAFDASAASAGGTDTPLGKIRMTSGLRYDSQAIALYLDQPTLDNVQPASGGERIDEQTRMLLNLWLADYARKQPLYRLDPALAANLGGLKVESTSIEDGMIKLRLNQPVNLPSLESSSD